MLEIELKNKENLQLKNLVLDYNGTIAFKGKIISGIKAKLADLSKFMDIYIITADTYGTVREEFEGQPVNIEITDDKITGTNYKKDFIKDLGPNNTIAVGNGVNDKLMLAKAGLSIAVIGSEGAAVNTVLKADIIINDILEGLDLLKNKNALKATLRK